MHVFRWVGSWPIVTFVGYQIWQLSFYDEMVLLVKERFKLGPIMVWLAFIRFVMMVRKRHHPN
jgi:hypothetical protein